MPLPHQNPRSLPPFQPPPGQDPDQGHDIGAPLPATEASLPIRHLHSHSKPSTMPFSSGTPPFPQPTSPSFAPPSSPSPPTTHSHPYPLPSSTTSLPRPSPPSSTSSTPPSGPLPSTAFSPACPPSTPSPLTCSPILLSTSLPQFTSSSRTIYSDCFIPGLFSRLTLLVIATWLPIATCLDATPLPQHWFSSPLPLSSRETKEGKPPWVDAGKKKRKTKKQRKKKRGRKEK